MKTGSSEFDVYVGARVREWRQRRGVSQVGLARDLGVSIQQVQKYEKGANRLSASRLRAVAKTLQVPVDEFFRGAEEQAALSDGDPYPGPAQFVETVEGLELIRCFRRITSGETRRRILELVRTLAAEERARGPHLPE